MKGRNRFPGVLTEKYARFAQESPYAAAPHLCAGDAEAHPVSRADVVARQRG